MLQEMPQTAIEKKQTALEIIQYHEKSKSEIEIKQGQLSDFLLLDPREHDYKQLKQEMEKALQVNLEQRLFRETFYIVEKSVLSRKLANFQQQTK